MDSIWLAIRQYRCSVAYLYHGERNHQGKANQLLFPRPAPPKCAPGGIRCQQRLGGLLKYYYQEAA
jgi:hypothetical protein